MLAEGRKVAVEVVGHLPDARRYANEYHFLITIRDDKISAVREYLDTQHVHAWFALLATPAAPTQGTKT